MNTVNMSSKEIINDLLYAATGRIFFTPDCAEIVTIEQIEKELPSWIMR
jgi:hypothetical protein